MRQAALTREQARQLAVLIRDRRKRLKLSLRKVAELAHTSRTSVMTLERGTNLTPLPRTIRGIGEALGISVTDLLVQFQWLPAHELPTLQPYLRAKYGLDGSDAAAVSAYLEQLQQRHSAEGDPEHGPPGVTTSQ